MTKLKVVAGVFFGIVSVVAGLAQDLPGGLRLGDTTKGKVWTDRRGMTLYVFDGDKGGTSSCYGTCAETWPPLKVEQPAAASGNFTVAVRKDGTNQLSYKGRPLYTWHKDNAPGDINGDGFRDTWHIAKP